MTFNVLVDDEKLEAKCTLEDRELITNAKYFCEVPTNSKDIKQITVEPNFNFDIQDNVTLVGITPFANMYKDKILNLDDKYDYIADSNIYVIEHSKRIQFNKKNFNISGVMFNSKGEFTSKDFDLLIYLISGNKTQINIQCSFAYVKENNNNYYYDLNCTSDEILEGLLQTAIAFIDNDIFVIYFDNLPESEIEIDINEDENKSEDTYRYSYKDKRKLTLILLCVFIPLGILSACVIFFVLYLRKRKKEKEKEKIEGTESTRVELSL